MKTNMTLVILAAGMGSRYGGLKQIEPMGPNQEFIIDYSVYDAIKAGFNKIVFLIKEENYDEFKNTIGKRVEPHIKVEYAFQKNDNIPKNIQIPESRIKPLGTAHAILCCKDVVHEPFMMINADDFYGRDAYIKGANFLKNVQETTPKTYGMISYLVKNTITENGSVKRGVCDVENNKLKKLIESKVERINGQIIAKPLSGAEEFVVDEDKTVSMNMLLFTPSIFNYIENHLEEYLLKHKNDIDTCEYLIPEVLEETLENGYATVDVIPTSGSWYGVTYKEDAKNVKEAIKSLIEKGEYNYELWK